MIAPPNTTISVLNGTATDDFGDTQDTATADSTGVPALILEQTRRVWMPAEGELRQVTYYTASVPYGTDVRAGNRIRDEQDSAIYAVAGVSQPKSSIAALDLQLDLRKVS